MYYNPELGVTPKFYTNLYILISVFLFVVLVCMILNVRREYKKKIDKTTNRTINEEALKNFLDEWDWKCIVDNRLYLSDGSKCIEYAGTSWKNNCKYACVAQLCKTNNGNWFYLKLVFINGEYVESSSQVVPENIEDVKIKFSKDIDLYREHFGEPEKA